MPLSPPILNVVHSDLLEGARTMFAAKKEKSMESVEEELGGFVLTVADVFQA